MASKSLSQLTGFRVIDMNEGVVTSSNNLVIIELKTRNNVMWVCLECLVLWLDTSIHPAPAQHVMSAIQGFVEVHVL
jgi:hypothetical protein